jgi:hypothetical protein
MISSATNLRRRIRVETGKMKGSLRVLVVAPTTRYIVVHALLAETIHITSVSPPLPIDSNSSEHFRYCTTTFANTNDIQSGTRYCTTTFANTNDIQSGTRTSSSVYQTPKNRSCYYQHTISQQLKELNFCPYGNTTNKPYTSTSILRPATPRRHNHGIPPAASSHPRLQRLTERTSTVTSAAASSTHRSKPGPYLTRCRYRSQWHRLSTCQ